MVTRRYCSPVIRSLLIIFRSSVTVDLRLFSGQMGSAPLKGTADGLSVYVCFTTQRVVLLISDTSYECVHIMTINKSKTAFSDFSQLTNK